MLFTTVLAALVATVAAKDKRTFAVLRHHGNGPLTTCRADPIVSPGGPSAHVHTVMGASNFGLNATGESLRGSKCTTAMAKADLSAYWFPTLYFKDPSTGLLEQVKMFYMNVYYFFDATNDNIKAFPTGLQIVSGNAMLRTSPSTSGENQLDPSKGPVQPVQITCPRGNFNPPSWPSGSDGSTAGIGSNNEGSGIGFPFQDCDGYASPMRVDVHFPSCYNPSAGLTNYRSNMQFPSDAGNGKLDCPPGWIHTPHMFFETYWDTHALLPRFKDLVGKASPFVFANGDTTGFSAHGDFISGWDEEELQHIIDTCDVGHAGIHTCPGLKYGTNDGAASCNIECPVDEVVDGKLEKLPGSNPLAGWALGGGDLPAVLVPVPSPSPSPSPSPKPQPGAGDSGSGSGSSSSSSPPPVEEKPSSSAAPPPATTLIPVPAPVLQQQPSAAADSSSSKEEPTPPPLPTAKPIRTTTVYDTVTVWETKTVYVDNASPAPTQAAQESSGKAAEDISGFKYVGCYKDTRERALSGEKLPSIGDVSNTACVGYCASKGFAIAGTEYGGECFCGDSLAPLEKLDDAKCAMACKGDEGQNCGGDWALTLYAKVGKLPGSGAAALRKRHASLTGPSTHGGSLKSRIYGSKDLKSPPAQVYALAFESSKWSAVLKEVVENSQLLQKERKLTPTLSILLAHDLLLAKKGVALPASHGLRVAVEKHKARLQSEFTRARIRRKCPTVEALKALVDAELGPAHPRWIRVNSLKSTVDEQLDTTFKGFEMVPTVEEVMASASTGKKVICLDGNVPNLIAASPGVDFTRTAAYKSGAIILQDKASCFPAYLLDPRPEDGDIIDACSAPGNKTTHLAGILHERGFAEGRRIFAFEKDKHRAKTLNKMVRAAGSDKVTVIRAGADFLKTDPNSPEFRGVGALLLDPSCSGSGIVGRDDTPEFHLPSAVSSTTSNNTTTSKNLKRKRPPSPPPAVLVDDDGAETVVSSEQALQSRLKALASFQLAILLHALAFPAATKVSYSTCSIHAVENEAVVLAALHSPLARARGWRVLARDQQVRGMREWPVRGDIESCDGDAVVAGACVRAQREDGRGVMGFFVACFVRDDTTIVGGDREEDDGPFVRDGEGRIVRDEEGIPTLKSSGRKAGGRRQRGEEESGDEDGSGDDEEEDGWGGFDD
ncbi:hypothetical protein C8A01DRAFT_46869 [Parachaetomium inaequale]|uniref:WSC domain-containing protein n=1 Tax=Parachaetomium inaequale TaxID=2588326 RepID=A0AAN6PEU9_9PEZI|nr:hypothetical protein C8A01DRAFT_46869 [Parachaetomium inaequale]